MRITVPCRPGVGAGQWVGLGDVGGGEEWWPDLGRPDQKRSCLSELEIHILSWRWEGPLEELLVGQMIIFESCLSAGPGRWTGGWWEVTLLAVKAQMTKVWNEMLHEWRGGAGLQRTNAAGASDCLSEVMKLRFAEATQGVISLKEKRSGIKGHSQV